MSRVAIEKEPDPEAGPDRGLRVTCCIDTLDQGGAQRQISLLAERLARRGHDVEVLTYRHTRFFEPVLEAAAIPVRRLPPSGKLRRAVAIRRALQARQPDVVIASLSGPGLYSELAGLPRRRFGLIVTEFTVPDDTVRLLRRVRWAAHRLADVVVTETEHVRRLVVQAVPGLGERTVVIRNGVDLDEFHSRDADQVSEPMRPHVTRVLIMAAYRPQKNPFGMLAAIEHVRHVAPRARVEFDWYGSTYLQYGQDGTYRALREAVRARRLEDVFRLHGPVRDSARRYREASLVCLPSFYEGCSNVICEASATGVPLVVSDVGDNRQFVNHGVTGFLADPHAPATIADAILRVHRLSPAARREMGRRARAAAETLFNPDRFVNAYETLIRRFARGQRGPAPDAHPTETRISGSKSPIAISHGPVHS